MNNSLTQYNSQLGYASNQTALVFESKIIPAASVWVHNITHLNLSTGSSLMASGYLNFHRCHNVLDGSHVIYKIHVFYIHCMSTTKQVVSSVETLVILSGKALDLIQYGPVTY